MLINVKHIIYTVGIKC